MTDGGAGAAEVLPVGRLGRVHFIGIGGAGMSGIARIMLRRGVPVSGSDMADSPLLDQLRDLGARVHVGHAAEHVGPADTVVVSTAIRDTNPELVTARERGLRILHRAEALAGLMRDRRAVTVAGTHGKTTTTSMLTVALRHCGADPSYCIGGQLAATGLGADEGKGDLFIAEADESDKSFLMFSPEAAVITNVEADHLDNYADFEQVKATFAAFVDRLAARGVLVVGADDPVARALGEAAAARAAENARAQDAHAADVRDGVAGGERAGAPAATRIVRTYGERADADYRVHDFTPRGLGSTFRVTGPAGVSGTVRLQVPGRHNALNAAAALAVAVELGFDFGKVCDGLAAFTGTHRRLEVKGKAGGVTVLDSYAHHPTELTADLHAIRDYLAEHAGADRGSEAPDTDREGAGRGRLIAVFQPHLFSRTRFFAAEFGAALGLADEAVVLDVYPAREDPIPGVTGRLVADAVPSDTRTHYEEVRDRVPALVADLARPGDIVITMGAGDVTRLGPVILDRIGRR